ncbi:phage tail protein [Cronobacter turicensis]|uniref:phage tail-collar fiber domain-containing protein n=3 Tax=Cronobacter turicensis TaxID=413502 RepID=UPI001D5100F8|nr:phage tail protein [Cronobacter turicensis]EGT4493491.1 hypothetical protein [Cronobacter turicensis]ELY4321575.1 phage tail protein [Cronobacter turicensis]ELY5942567.1 phage tail protein [Cronobacter turicensis]MDI6416059.1 phage tail protein [Cronobacter turicensis]MDI7672745.1 phage tail protein [Cronobacter turicensis]
MSQTVITLAFEQWKAQQGVTGEAILLDEFVFANVPGLNPDAPISRSETLPPAAQVVHRQAVTRKGVVNENAVVHSVVLGADVGDFSFNWIGLMNKASGTLAMIVHAPVQQKLKTKAGQQGNVLTRSFLMEYNGAQAETGINTPAETWQIDFTARLAGMDERQRLENIDVFGAAAFLGDGWLVGKTGTQYFVTPGTGYVQGLRAQLAASQNITVTTKPVKVWLDLSWEGSLVSSWQVKSQVTVAANLADYVQNGVQHYVFALASIDANGVITDLRPKGSLAGQDASDAMKKHEQSRNHPDATLNAKGFTQLSSAVDSTAEDRAATPKAVKAANDNANGRVPSGRTVNGRALSEDINITAQDIFNGQAVSIGSATDLNTCTVPGLYYQLANSQAANGKNYPEPVAGSLEVYKHAGITQIYRIYNHSRAYIRTAFNGTWSAWAQQYDEANKPTAAEVGALPAGGTAVAASRLATARKIAGVAFDGTADIAIPAGSVGAYTKAEGDARYQPKGSYTPAGQAYTKAESDARFQKINSASLGENGWFRDTNTGVLIQYGKVAVTTSGQGVTFPVAFSIVPSLSLNVNSGTYGDVGASSTSTTGFVIAASQRNTVGWMAIGR